LLKRLCQGPDLIENVIIGRLRYKYCRLSFRIAVADRNRDCPNPIRAWLVVEIADVGLRFDGARHPSLLRHGCRDPKKLDLLRRVTSLANSMFGPKVALELAPDLCQVA
jgi:hypothetical protein